jgi:hypothetical protein
LSLGRDIRRKTFTPAAINYMASFYWPIVHLTRFGHRGTTRIDANSDYVNASFPGVTLHTSQSRSGCGRYLLQALCRCMPFSDWHFWLPVACFNDSTLAENLLTPALAWHLGYEVTLGRISAIWDFRLCCIRRNRNLRQSIRLISRTWSLA